MRELSKKRPAKVKEFFVKIDQTSRGRLFEVKNYKLIQMLFELASCQVIYNYLKDIAVVPFSMFTLSIINNCLTHQRYQEDPSWSNHIRSQAIKTLNSLLLHRSIEDIRQVEDFGKYFMTIYAYLSEE